MPSQDDCTDFIVAALPIHVASFRDVLKFSVLPVHEIIVSAGAGAARQKSFVQTDVMVHGCVRRDIVWLVPPEEIYDESADAVAKCVEFQQRDRLTVTQPGDTRSTEPESLGAGDDLCDPTGFAFVDDLVVAQDWVFAICMTQSTVSVFGIPNSRRPTRPPQAT